MAEPQKKTEKLILCPTAKQKNGNNNGTLFLCIFQAKNSWKFVVNSSSSLEGVVQSSFWPCPTDRVRSKFMSDAKLGSLRNSSWNFELNPASHYRGVVCPLFWGVKLLTMPYWLCTVKIFVRCKTKDPKEHFLKFWA